MNRYKKVLTNEGGAALAFVIVALMVTTLLVGSALFIASANTRQASNQDQGIQTYYLARSGAEAAYEAIITKGKLSQLVNIGDRIAPDTVAFDFDNDGVTDGSAVVSAESYTDPGNGSHRVRIQSVGSMAGSTLTRTVTVDFDYSEHNDIVWGR